LSLGEKAIVKQAIGEKAIVKQAIGKKNRQKTIVRKNDGLAKTPVFRNQPEKFLIISRC
jgi:hypothetical protein